MSKLILTHEVTGLGAPGDVVDVKNGFARNYLIPQGWAVMWTRGAEKQIEQIKAARTAREHATIEEAQDLKARLQATPVTLTVKAGGEGASSVPSRPLTSRMPLPPLGSVLSTSARSSSARRSRRPVSTRRRCAFATIWLRRSPSGWSLPSSPLEGRQRRASASSLPPFFRACPHNGGWQSPQDCTQSPSARANPQP